MYIAPKPKVSAVIYTSIRRIVLDCADGNLVSYIKSICSDIGKNLEAERILSSYYDIPILPGEYIVGFQVFYTESD